MIWKMCSDVNVSCRRSLRLRRSRIVNWLHQLVPNPLQLSIGGPVPEVGYNAYDNGVPAEQWREDGTGMPR